MDRAIAEVNPAAGATDLLLANFQPAPLPLSAAQFGIWLGQRLAPASPAYWTAEAVQLAGALHRPALTAAVQQALSEAECLHQRYQELAGEGVFQWPVPPRVELEWLDLSAADDPAAAAAAWMEADLARPADLAQGPLFHTALLRLAPDRHRWYLRVHHIALDGYGHSLLANRVAALYTAFTADMARPQASAALSPVIAEDQAWQAGPASERSRQFWLQRLREAPPPVLLAPPRPLADQVLRRRGAVPAERWHAWRQAATLAGVDWTAWLTAGVLAWLYRRSGCRQLRLGLPAMNRLGSAALRVPCMAMNIVPPQMTVDPDAGFARLLARTAAELGAIRPHQRYRYEQLRHDLDLPAQAAAAPDEPARGRLFGPILNLMPFDRPPAFGALLATVLPVAAGPVEDLAISVAPSGSGLRLDLEANPDAYSAAQLEELHASLLQALTLLAEAGPDDPPGLHHRLVSVPPFHAGPPALLDGGPLPQPAEPVLASLIRQAADRPAAVALEQAGESWTYAELLGAIQALAGELTTHGVGPGQRVALFLPREPQTVIALLAILWAGAAYLPLDPAGPAARCQAVLDDARPALALTLSSYAKRLPAALPALQLDLPIRSAAVHPAAPLLHPVPVPDDAPAYQIYTSGSTGRPNGVVISRGALAHFVAGAAVRYAITSDDRVLQFAPLHFDASVEEIFLPLCHGSTLVLRTDPMLDSLPQFLAACSAQRITVLDLPTAYWHELAYFLGAPGTASQLPETLRLVIIGGEAALPDRVARWRMAAPPSVVLLNTYGPTEATVIATTATLAGPDALPLADAAAGGGGRVPIGRPLPGVTAVVVDHDLRPVLPGTAGELCLLGGGLAAGYWERDQLTAARFVSLPALAIGADAAKPPRAYRTGDRAVLGLDGQLAFLGRCDHELKISGHRVDPLEAEVALQAYPGVQEAAVTGQSLPDGNGLLVAHLVGLADPGEGDAPALLGTDQRAAVHDFLAERLAAPAIPGHFLVHVRLPRNRNGKIDRGALRREALDVLKQAGDRLPLAGERALAPADAAVIEVWQAVLGMAALGPDSDFFALGGRSLQAIQIANRLALAFGCEVPVSLLFRYPTVAALAGRLQHLAAAEAAAAARLHRPSPQQADAFAPVLTLQPGREPALFCIHPAEGLAWCYLGLARHLPGRAIHGLQAAGLTGEVPASFAAMAAGYVAAIRSLQPQGPYHLLGWSSGGALAQQVAVQLQGEGAVVGLLAVLDGYPSDAWQDYPLPTEREALEALLDVTGDPLTDAAGAPLSPAAIRERLRRPGSSLAGCSAAQLSRLVEVALQGMRLFRASPPARCAGDLLLFRATARSDGPDWPSWTPHVGGAIDVVPVDSSHEALTQPAALAVIGPVLADRLARSDRRLSAIQP